MNSERRTQNAKCRKRAFLNSAFRVLRSALIVFSVLLLTLSASADEPSRLMTLARIWAMAKYLDPSVTMSGVDWDKALVKAIPAVRAAKDDDELAAAVGAMLRTLGDPATTVESINDPRSTGDAPRPTGEVPLYRVEQGILILQLGPYSTRYGADAMYSVLSTAFPEVTKSSGLVIDLRGGLETNDDVAFAVGIIPTLARETVTAPSVRAMVHSGYASQDGSPNGGFYSGFLTLPGAILKAPKDGKAPARVVFVAGGMTRVPAVAIALRNAGLAAIVSETSLDEGNFAATRIEPLDAKHVVRLRTGHLLDGNLREDIVTPDPLGTAIAIATEKQPMPKHGPRSAAAILEPERLRERDYPEMGYPAVEYRLLAAFRIWSVTSFFYPYKHLIGDWDGVLRTMIPRFIAAKDANEYTTAVLEMVAHVEDGHSGVRGPGVQKLFGEWLVPFRVMHVEGEPAIVEIYRDLPKDADVHIGDVVVSVDGEPMTARMARLLPLVTASSETPRRDRLANSALLGAANSTVVLELRGAGGTLRKVSLARVARIAPDTGRDPFRLLPGNIGYVNLMQLTVPQVPAMFEALKETKGIIFDLRGYPNGTAWPISPRINTKHAKIGALFRRPMFTGNQWASDTTAGWYFEQEIPKGEGALYTGKLATLIDDRAVSQSEHTCLFFEQAAGMTFIGTPTAGTNGDISFYPVPGALWIRFSGHDVRHADGRQLQRIGIRPDITASPTLAGLQGGKDEVLDRAIAWMNDIAH
jgi:C-terminal processing protease CtpA/Prc